MIYLVDSDVVIDWLNGRASTTQQIASVARDGLAISIVTYGEVFEGVYFGRNPRLAQQGLQRFLKVAQVLPLTRQTMQRFAQVRGELRQKGQLIGDLDILIAATALSHNLTLITNNRAHFERIPGLLLYSPP